MPGSALDWWRSFLEKERAEAKLQCSECKDLKLNISVLKDSKNDSKADRSFRRQKKACYKDDLADHRYPPSLYFIHLFQI